MNSICGIIRTFDCGLQQVNDAVLVVARPILHADEHRAKLWRTMRREDQRNGLTPLATHYVENRRGYEVIPVIPAFPRRKSAKEGRIYADQFASLGVC